jgi:hypothetical protein
LVIFMCIEHPAFVTPKASNPRRMKIRPPDYQASHLEPFAGFSS